MLDDMTNICFFAIGASFKKFRDSAMIANTIGQLELPPRAEGAFRTAGFEARLSERRRQWTV